MSRARSCSSTMRLRRWDWAGSSAADGTVAWPSASPEAARDAIGPFVGAHASPTRSATNPRPAHRGCHHRTPIGFIAGPPESDRCFWGLAIGSAPLHDAPPPSSRGSSPEFKEVQRDTVENLCAFSSAAGCDIVSFVFIYIIDSIYK